MANFINISENKYKIEGKITLDDIKKINSFKNNTLLILDNTVGQDSELIGKIRSERVFFSIKGGLDYEKIDKYNNDKYKKRTYLSPYGLRQILKYFEYNESQINPEWNDLQKCMYMYNALVVDMEYDQDYDNILESGVTERSLNGILYGKLVCAGFALVFKEMMDRLNIKCHYQNQQNIHAFNVIEIENKFYGIDPTWDNCKKNNLNDSCKFIYFAQDEEFYSKYGHNLYKEVESFEFEEPCEIEYDKEETMFPLSILSKEEIQTNYNIIENSINLRKPFRYDLGNQDITIKNKFLPIDNIKYRHIQEAKNESPYFKIISFLDKNDSLNINEQLKKTLIYRNNYISDIAPVSMYDYISGVDIEIDELKNFEFYSNGSFKCPIDNTISKESMFELLNKRIQSYLDNYLENLLQNSEKILESYYEDNPNTMDENRSVEHTNAYFKANIILNAKDYLINSGYDQTKLELINNKIISKIDEVDKIRNSYIDETNQKDNDLDFLYAVFSDLYEIKEIFEKKKQKKLTKKEFYEKYLDINYIMKTFDKFDINEYSITLDDLNTLLHKIVSDYEDNIKLTNDAQNNSLK